MMHTAWNYSTKNEATSNPEPLSSAVTKVENEMRTLIESSKLNLYGCNSASLGRLSIPNQYLRNRIFHQFLSHTKNKPVPSTIKPALSDDL